MLLHPVGALAELAQRRPRSSIWARCWPRWPSCRCWRRCDLLGALPALAQNLLGQDPILYDHRTQYQSFVLPFLFLAAIGGYERLARRRPGAWPVAVLVVAMMVSLALASRTVNNLAIARFWPGPEQRAAYQVIAQVPAGAAVSAQDPYVAHLSLRPLVFVFPVGIEKSDYVSSISSSYPWRNLPGVDHGAPGRARVTIAAPDGASAATRSPPRRAPPAPARAGLSGALTHRARVGAVGRADAGRAAGDGPVADERGNEGQRAPRRGGEAEHALAAGIPVEAIGLAQGSGRRPTVRTRERAARGRAGHATAGRSTAWARRRAVSVTAISPEASAASRYR